MVELSPELTAAAGFVALVIASVFTYITKKPTPKESVVTSVGVEFGNRIQMDQMSIEMRRIADGVEKLVTIFGDKDKEATKDRLDDIQQMLTQLHRAEERERQR